MSAPAEKSTPSSSPALSESRFEPSRITLWFDRFMTYFIKFGGILVVTAVFGIFVFILSQIFPLFRGAKVEELRSVQLPAGDYKILGADEWSELPFVVDEKGRLTFLDIVGNRPPQVADLGLGGETEITAADYSVRSQRLAIGTANGQFAYVDLNYGRQEVDGKDAVVQSAKSSPLYAIGPQGSRVKEISFGDADAQKLVASIVDVQGKLEVHATILRQSRSLIGAGKVTMGEQFDLTSSLKAPPQQVLASSNGETVLVATADGDIYHFHRTGAEMGLRQVFQPFGDLSDKAVSSMNFVLGDVSVSVTNQSGENRIWSLFVPPGQYERLFGMTKKLPSLPAAARFHFPSMRNKAYLTGSGSTASLRYSTTADIRWEKQFDFGIRHGALSGKYDRILLLDDSHKLHLFDLNDPHPEASWTALFGKIWYEGYSTPTYTWQSTGGTDDFEPKLSLIPLIFGTLKGTLFAMLFSLPIALLAAVYTSQFLRPELRRVVKPMMEVMASLPSVVLGFLAALWLAPILESRIPSVLCIVLFVPISALIFGYFWAGLPIHIRRRIPAGYEFLAYLPVLFFFGWLGWNLGPTIEQMLFVVTNPDTGTRVADFRYWWPAISGASFEQRNSLVVGIAMGFAVIPLIFTITEDALSNVPGQLRSASLALGASRWQTAVRVVLPTASAGIFSAIMIGLGRAVGETMIVVMATGNTPIMEWNIFSGMRTLSANIAVELPEAPHHSTLYRTLFLGAMALFIMTFFVNTVAELLRQHLRERYKTV